MIDFLVGLARDACLVADSKATVLAANEEAVRLYRCSLDELIGMPLAELYSDESAHLLTEELGHDHSRRPWRDAVHRRRDGSEFPVEVAWTSEDIADDRIYIAYVRDITTRMLAEDEFRLKSEIFDAMLDAIIVHDLSGRLVQANRAAAVHAGTGYAAFQRIEPWGWISEPMRPQVLEQMRRVLECRSLIFDSEGLRADGTRYPTEVHARLIEREEGHLLVSVIRDITERRRAEETVRYLAFHDPLTGLANRARFLEDLNRGIADARRHGDVLVVAYLDLDMFKPVNDSLGHAAGDQVLVEIAQRLSSRVRSTDTVARMGGDEFAVVLPRVRDIDAMDATAIKLASAVAEPSTIQGVDVSVTASIGLAAFDPASDDADSLLAKADGAMYEARSRGVVWKVHGRE